jgi:hypothetical protein
VALQARLDRLALELQALLVLRASGLQVRQDRLDLRVSERRVLRVRQGRQGLAQRDRLARPDRQASAQLEPLARLDHLVHRDRLAVVAIRMRRCWSPRRSAHFNL